HDSKEEQAANTVSTLLDGYWYVLNDGTATISRTIPPSGVAEALQNGPLLIENANARNLTITDDEYARRSLIAHTTDGAIVLMTIFFPTSQLEGPLLAELPQLLITIGDTENLSFESALNLDGGSASGILTLDEHLSEFSNVGSIVCAQ
ncbi:MAG: phosphodiester glycosidase family protein, partial [Candidatus Roizmanbacteria bacterium]|nr:phosphodiester glycosidase family protein [Candidatus Roizmanbacteria bacterium]